MHKGVKMSWYSLQISHRSESNAAEALNLRSVINRIISLYTSGK